MDYQIIQSFKNGYNVKCNICGHTKFMKLHNYQTSHKLMHNGINCGNDYYESLVGEIIDDYQIIGMEQCDPCGKHLYKIKCLKCGVEEIVGLRSLQLKKGFSHGLRCMKNIPDSEYKKVIIERFNDIKQRCENPNNSNYIHYGLRGIKCEYKYPIDLYNDFIEELIQHSSVYGLRNSTFDRIDVNGNYCKENLRIATQTMQSTNTTRKKLFILFKDDQRILSDNAMYVGKYLHINGRSVGNLIRGNSKSAGGWRLYKIIENTNIIDIDFIVKNENVTTNLIIS